MRDFEIDNYFAPYLHLLLISIAKSGFGIEKFK